MFYIEPLSNIAGVSILTWIFLYVSSVVFEFCSYHRVFLWYILIDDLFNIIDYYWKIPLGADIIFRFHNSLIGITLLITMIMYVRDNKITFTEYYQEY